MLDQTVKNANGSGRERFVFVDALRGIAALMVLSHHLLHNTHLEDTIRSILPGWLCAVFIFNMRGVEIFFVISGFVIAHSLTKVEPSIWGAGNFIVRRQLRLDPPYWAIMALTLADLAIENRIPSIVQRPLPLPSPGELVANALYLQNILRTSRLIGVAWTLCLEIQFYLIFILAHIIGRSNAQGRGGASFTTVAIVVGLGILSLFNTGGQTSRVIYFVPFWSYFSAGILCYWAYRKYVPGWTFFAFLAAFGVAMAWYRSSFMLVGFITVLALYVAGERQQLSHWLSNKPIQYFGKISYSLYLVHFLVLSIVMRAGYRLTHTNRWAALFWMFAAALGAIAAAHLFHKLIEVPSMRLAGRLKTRKGGGAVAPSERLPTITSAAPVVAATQTLPVR